jgi:hypothetical protein
VTSFGCEKDKTGDRRRRKKIKENNTCFIIVALLRIKKLITYGSSQAKKNKI